ncbi:MAG: hypothetical protein QOJ09_1122, partial [Actinomycetota bacterium]|nr:hypothetical protein [Actinomycetota bacterium]
MDVRSNVRAGKVLTFVGVLMLVVGLMQTGAGAGGWKTASSGAPGQAKKHQAVTTTTVAVDAASSANTDCGSYCSTSDGTPSMNGNGDGGGKPCAGCVGNADDKNPPGQYKDGSDHNNGYECDGNNGVGKTNPAHSGCKPTTTTTPQQTTTTAVHQSTTTTAAQATTTTAPHATTTTIAATTTTAAVGGATTTTADVLGVQFTRGTETSRGLASTGAGFFRPFMLLGALMLLLGVALMTIKVSPQ